MKAFALIFSSIFMLASPALMRDQSPATAQTPNNSVSRGCENAN